LIIYNNINYLILGYFNIDKKHGKGAYFYNNNSYMISNFKENNPTGLSIFYSVEKGEQIVYMESNKVIKTINASKELQTIKDSNEYKELIKFFEGIPNIN